MSFLKSAQKVDFFASPFALLKEKKYSSPVSNSCGLIVKFEETAVRIQKYFFLLFPGF